MFINHFSRPTAVSTIHMVLHASLILIVRCWLALCIQKYRIIIILGEDSGNLDCSLADLTFLRVSKVKCSSLENRLVYETFAGIENFARGLPYNVV